MRQTSGPIGLNLNRCCAFIKAEIGGLGTTRTPAKANSDALLSCLCFDEVIVSNQLSLILIHNRTGQKHGFALKNSQRLAHAHQVAQNYLYLCVYTWFKKLALF